MILTNVILAGIYGGLATGIWVMMMKMIGFTSMDITTYAGCFITKKNSGFETFIAGLLMHFTLSIIIAFVYFYMFHIIDKQGLGIGLFVGLIHWAITGMMLPATDAMNHCVKTGTIMPMKLYASGYGMNGILTFFLGHMLYGAFVGLFLII